MKQNVTLAEVINAGIDAHLGELHTLLVGRVEAVNAAARKVDVRLATVRVLADEHGTPLIEEMPILRQVPIGALRAGAARIDMPIATGHWVCVLFFEDNIGKWLAGGGVSVSPADVERHGLSGG